MAVGDVYIGMGVEKNGRIPVERYEEVGDSDGITYYRRLGPAKVSGTWTSVGKMFPTATGQRMGRFQPVGAPVGSPETPGGTIRSIVLDSDSVYVGTSTGRLMKYSRDLHLEATNYDSTADIRAMDIMGQSIYVGRYNGTLTRYRTSDLHEQQSINIPEAPHRYPTAIECSSDSRVYVGDTGSEVHRYDRTLGTRVAESPASIGGMVTSIHDDYNYIYVTRVNKAYVWMYQRNSLAYVGESVAMGGRIRDYAAIPSQGTIAGYTGHNDGAVNRLLGPDLDMKTHSHDYGGAVNALAIDGDYLYVGGNRNNQYRLQKLRLSDLSLVYESYIPLISGSIRAMAADNGEIFVGFDDYLIKSYTELYREIG